MAQIAPIKRLSLKTQVMRFLLTGAIAGVVDFGTYLLFSEGSG